MNLKHLNFIVTINTLFNNNAKKNNEKKRYSGGIKINKSLYVLVIMTKT